MPKTGLLAMTLLFLWENLYKAVVVPFDATAFGAKRNEKLAPAHRVSRFYFERPYPGEQIGKLSVIHT